MSVNRIYMKRTPLYQQHADLGGKLVQFAGWEMPIQFEGILAEVKNVRSYTGMFDVSHMGRLEISGTDSPDLLDKISTSHISNMSIGRARYTLICNDAGGIIDDTIIYRTNENTFLMIPNASNEGSVIIWLNQCIDDLGVDVQLNRLTDATVMIAVQGPQSTRMLQSICSSDLSQIRQFHSIESNISGNAVKIATTGYTGENGYEIISDTVHGPEIWSTLIDMGVTPCGLGARDVLKIEAGLLLHGSDMDAKTTPLEAGLNRFVSFDKSDFFGLSALRSQKASGIKKILIGFQLEDKGIPRHGYNIIYNGNVVGEVTSGTYSPSLDTGIGLGYVPINVFERHHNLQIDIRGRMAKARIVSLPFYSRKK